MVWGSSIWVGIYNASQIKYLIVLVHSAAHPFRNDGATEATEAACCPFSANAGDLMSNRRDFLTLFFLADTTLS